MTQIASALGSPHLTTRKVILDLLVFLAVWNDGAAYPMVIAGLESLSTSHNEGEDCFAYWFKTMEQSLSGRGKMGSLVGASEEVRRGGSNDSSLNEYAVSFLDKFVTWRLSPRSCPILY